MLGLLPGIGPAKAAQIVAYRKRHPFRTVDELVRIKGIGRKMVRRLRAHLAVSGPTTAPASSRRRRRRRPRRRAPPPRRPAAPGVPRPGPPPTAEARAPAHPRHLPAPALIAARSRAASGASASRLGAAVGRGGGAFGSLQQRAPVRQRRRLVVADRLARRLVAGQRRLDRRARRDRARPRPSSARWSPAARRRGAARARRVGRDRQAGGLAPGDQHVERDHPQVDADARGRQQQHEHREHAAPLPGGRYCMRAVS